MTMQIEKVIALHRATRDTDAALRDEFGQILSRELMAQIESARQSAGMSFSEFIEAVANAPGAFADQVGWTNGVTPQFVAWILSQARLKKMN